ncbi:MAG: OmpA family protein [Paludibacter sp.]|nr:OmpA family protein [Paludibacter sp.]
MTKLILKIIRAIDTRIALIVLLGLFQQYVIWAQLETSTWIFGYGVGLDFSTGKPVVFNDSKIHTTEGCACISDANGNLLFYTDGITVWNRNNEVMPNGFQLNGHISSTQSVVIVPRPGSDSQYYIFTLDWEAEVKGFSQSIVDMSKAAGMGDVVMKNKFIKKHCTERIVAVKHANNCDLWIIIHEFNSDAFCAYLLTEDGLSEQPVVSNIGIKHEKSRFNTIGYMKISMDKNRLAVAITGDALVQIFDFDNETGVLTNPRTLKFPEGSNPYGIEFSPDNHYMYLGLESKGFVYQIDNSKSTEQELKTSMKLIGKNKDYLGAFQLAVDGRIYIADYNKNSLSVIDKPDERENSCGLRFNAIDLGNEICQFGLPTFQHELVRVYDFAARPLKFSRRSKAEVNRKYILNNVYFDFNEVLYKKTSMPELKHLMVILKKNENLKIEITGHTDSIGTKEYNDRLSLSRARQVGMFLRLKGISEDRITCYGKGCAEPVATNKTDEGRQENRRVEFLLTKETE